MPKKSLLKELYKILKTLLQYRMILINKKIMYFNDIGTQSKDRNRLLSTLLILSYRRVLNIQ